MEHQREFIEKNQYGKQIGDMKNRQKRHQAPKPILLGLESEESENRIPCLGLFEKYMKLTHTNSVQNVCDAFPNELTRFRIEVKSVWGKIQKHCKNAVIILMWL